MRRGRLAVASIPSAASRILLAVVADFTRRFPGIDVQVIALASRDVERCVVAGETDLVIAPASEHNSELSFDFLLRARFVSLVPRSSRLAKQRRDGRA